MSTVKRCALHLVFADKYVIGIVYDYRKTGARGTNLNNIRPNLPKRFCTVLYSGVTKPMRISISEENWVYNCTNKTAFGHHSKVVKSTIPLSVKRMRP